MPTRQRKYRIITKYLFLVSTCSVLFFQAPAYSVEEAKVGKGKLLVDIDFDTGKEMFSSSNIESIMHKVNAYQLAHLDPKPDRAWIRPTYYTGVMAFYNVSGDKTLRDQAMAWAEKHNWQHGDRGGGANVLTASQTYLELYFDQKNPAMIKPTIDWLNSGDPKTPTGADIWYLGGKRHRYADSLYVGPPTLAMLGKATGDKKYFDYMDAFYWDVHAKIFDKESELFYRDKRFIKGEDGQASIRLADVPEEKRKRTSIYQISTNGKKVFWARGNGWVIAGLPRIMMYLPKDHPSYEKYEELLKTMAYRLKDRQGEDGYWRANLDDADDFPMPESSGTGFFTYAMAWGINNGILPESEFLPVVKKAWKALYNGVSDEGKVQWGQLGGAGPFEVHKEHSDEYVTGTFLLAGSEVLKLNSPRRYGTHLFPSVGVQPTRQP